ncbi:hypothetical protein M8C21_030069 [Ambrosia artemisiifolia]|uniref:Uncharacterized protein n=1 Tax=Ambrosia artemisiifolia TaxID=4212 RepID=A0AAD5GJI7_AMBAR|nr:hypothetical protein M8C21_030069 [Ambrosia artemisiifolia]
MDDHAMDNKTKLLNHNSTIKGFGDNVFITALDDLNHEMATKGRNNKQKDCGSKNKKDKSTKGQKVKKSKELVHRRQRQHLPKSVSFKIPPKNKRVHQQPGFNLDYSPPKTHPPSHN